MPDHSASAARSSSRSSRGRGKLIAASVFTLLVVALLIWWNHALKTPEVVIPTPRMPSPNGFDTLVSAGNQQLDGTKIGFAISSYHDSNVKDDHDYSLWEKEKLLNENAGTLKMLRQGLTEEYQNPPCRSFLTLFPYWAKFRSMARLLVLEGQVKAAKGDWVGATNSSLDSIALGMKTPKGAPLIGGLVGIAITAIGRRPLWENFTHLNAPQTKAACRRLEELLAQRISFSETMQEEKWAGEAGLMEIMRSPNSATSLIQMGQAQGAGSNPSIPPWALQLIYLFYSKQRIIGDYSSYMNSEIARSKKPYAAHIKETRVPNNPIVKVLAPTFSDAGFAWVKNEAQNRLLLISMALRAYALEHGGHYPATLSELAPGYLKQIPDDPFALQGSFLYRPNGSSYLLYSIGPDSVDDGGKVIDSGRISKTSPNVRYNVQQNSLGDIVAGKNIQ